MKIARSSTLEFIPASHEDPNDPGVFKKVLFDKFAITPGQVQMVNWAKMPKGKSFQLHYHEDMDEVFIIVEGEASMTIDGQTEILNRGDAVVVPAGGKHLMSNHSEGAVEYIVFGVSREKGGKTIVITD